MGLKAGGDDRHAAASMQSGEPGQRSRRDRQRSARPIALCAVSVTRAQCEIPVASVPSAVYSSAAPHHIHVRRRRAGSSWRSRRRSAERPANRRNTVTRSRRRSSAAAPRNISVQPQRRRRRPRVSLADDLRDNAPRRCAERAGKPISVAARDGTDNSVDPDRREHQPQRPKHDEHPSRNPPQKPGFCRSDPPASGRRRRQRRVELGRPIQLRPSSVSLPGRAAKVDLAQSATGIALRECSRRGARRTTDQRDVRATPTMTYSDRGLERRPLGLRVARYRRPETPR